MKVLIVLTPCQIEILWLCAVILQGILIVFKKVLFITLFFLREEPLYKRQLKETLNRIHVEDQPNGLYRGREIMP